MNSWLSWKNKANLFVLSSECCGLRVDSRLRGNDKQQESVLISVNPVQMECKLKKQSQFIRIEWCVMRIAKRNLKKQSQFPKGQIGVKSYMKGDYEEIVAVWARKNKAKQSQFFRSAF